MSDPLLDRLLETYQHWLHLPDPGVVHTVLATVAANRMAGDPVWTLIVGPPGGGKTEIIGGVSRLDEVKFAATLTEASLLSGTSKKERTTDATGGLLRQIGPYGIIVCKDFTSVLAMNHQTRGPVLAALREIYDGSWTRLVGVDGGKTLHWEGKVGMIAGCTPSIDRHHAVMGSMGERFVLYRMPVGDDAETLAERSLGHVGQEAHMRRELRDATYELLTAKKLPEAPPLPAVEDKPRLVRLAVLAVRCRSTVERDSYSREIELIPEPEAPTRLVNVLARMLSAYRLIGVENSEAWRLVAKLALDSMPAIRRTVIDVLLAGSGEPTGTDDVAEAIDYPTSTTRRALEDLTAHGVCQRHGKGRGNAHRWTVSEWTRDRFPVFPPHGFVGSVKDAPTCRPGLSGNLASDDVRSPE